MSQETEVISCPACHHLLQVPLDWLGQTVQCPECKATFQAPIRDGDTLSVPQLISRLPQAVATNGPGRKLDVMLLLPAFGLLLCGVIGMIVNGMMTVKVFDPVAGKDWAKNMVLALRQAGFGADDPPQEQETRDTERTERIVRGLHWVLPAAGVVSGVVFLGGLAITLRWNYRLAQVGCVLAALNVPHLCCLPGAVAGLWGLLMLNSEEGRAHFQR